MKIGRNDLTEQYITILLRMNSKWYVLINGLRRFNEVCKRSVVNEIKEVKSNTEFNSRMGSGSGDC